MNDISTELILTGVGVMVSVHLAFAGWVVSNARSISGAIDRMTTVLNRLTERLAITETHVEHIARDVQRLEHREETQHEKHHDHH